METKQLNQQLNGQKESLAVRESVYGYIQPRCDIREMNDRYVLYLEMPGVDRTGVTATLENGLLIIDGKTSWKMEGVPVRTEIAKRNYRRVFRLTQVVDPESIEAHWRNGILMLHMTKKESARSREIQINFN